jgi:putative ABC transport system permease protein
MIHDLRLAARLLLKTPAFSAVAVLVLALGIGANTMMFSAFDAVMLRPLPYTDPDRIVLVWDTFPQLGVTKIGPTYGNAADLRERSQSFDLVGFYQAASTTAVNLTGLAGPERIQSTRATGDFFRVMNVAPHLGRTLTTDDEEPGRNRVAVLGYDLWRRDFGSDPQVIGRAIKLNDEDYTVVGVMPPGFAFPSGGEMAPGQQFASATEVWVPLTVPPEARADRLLHSLRVVARLKPGVTVERAEAEASAIVAELVAEHPSDNEGLGVSVLTMRENQVGELRPALLVLLGAVGVVLLIACANIANLMLSRAAVREREFAVRAALGASRARIVRQLLTESLLLSALGGLVGLMLAAAATRLLVAFSPAGIPRLNEIGLDVPVLVFTNLVTFATGLLFGLAPALHASKPDLYGAIKEGARGASSGSGQHRLRSLLVVSEVVLVFVLLIAAGLLLKSFGRLLAVAPGFDPHDVLAARVTLPARPYPAPRKLLFYGQLVDQLRALPDVEAAAVVRDLPLSGTDPRYGFAVQGQENDPQSGMTLRYRMIGPDYFKVMGIPLLSGRPFTERDDQNAPGVVILNQSAVRKYFSGRDPVGQVLVCLTEDVAPKECRVVGVVGDVRFGGLDSESDPELYINYPQLPEKFTPAAIGSMAVVVRTANDPMRLAASLRERVAALDKDVPVTSVTTMDDALARSLAPRRFTLFLVAGFAGVALVLAGVGIYGVISYWVAQRTREIGIRVALGAQASDIMKLVVRQSMSVVLVGLGVGFVAALGLAVFLSKALAGVLFGLTATDPATFAWVALLIASIGLFASYVPSRRAVRVDPTIALRSE